jgi:methanogenic corrinoid protein MtbC1
MDVQNEIALAVADILEDRAETLVNDSLAQGVDAKLLLDGVIAGLQEVGHRFETQEYFMLELMEAGELGKNLIGTITPHLPKLEGARKGKVVFGSSKGDIHDIGKNLVITQLELAGFDVIDLGVDVPSMAFIDKARETGADIIAMSAFLTTTMAYFSEVVQYLKDMGLRDKYKVIVGGGTTSEEFAASIGADGTAPDAVKALKLCEKLMAEKRS